jgi:sortilin (neurotensin receptor 3)
MPSGSVTSSCGRCLFPPRTSIIRTFRLLIAICAATLAASVDQVRSQSIFAKWTVSEFQPDIQRGGRANTFAVHPSNDDIVFVASETGGLFRSNDRGVRWRHVDNLPSFKTNSVAFVPSNPDTVIVTTSDDFKVNGGGGVWRSTDGGASWTQAAIAFPAGVAGRLSGSEVRRTINEIVDEVLVAGELEHRE